MIKKILYFGSNAYIHTRKKQLIVEFNQGLDLISQGLTSSETLTNEVKTLTKKKSSIPLEDIGVAIFDAPQMTISRAVLSGLLDNNAAVIICNEKHMPKGLLLNLDANNIQQELFRIQINAGTALKNNLWQQTIKTKIQNQRFVLEAIGADGKKLKFWEDKIKSGDPENIEGRAAAYYWKNIFSDFYKTFKRERFGNEPNSLLNYGYAILRAVVARNLIASGLLPTFGIHHHNKYNAYTLADDIMEPYRPFVDWVVREIIEEFYDETWRDDDFNLTPALKKELLKIPLIDVQINGKTRPLMIAVRITTASLSECFAKNKRKITYPKF